MLWRSSYFIWSIFCLFMFDQIHISSGIRCNPGEKVTLSKTGCEPCLDRQYNPKYTESNECLHCVPCGVNSVEVSPCTAISNTKCKCLESFIPFDDTHKRCGCMSDSVTMTLGNGKTICKKCPPNTFPDKSNTVCKPLLGEKVPGNSTSDDSDGDVMKTASPLPVSQASTGTSTMTPTTSRNSVSTPTTSIPEPQDSRKHSLWLASLIAFLLLILILKLSRNPKKKRDIVREGSACGKPVEESGEKFLPPV